MESLRKSDDFSELLSHLNGEQARYLIVGGFALAHYGQPRYTKDLDIWVDRSAENAARVFRALAKFGAPLDAVVVDDFSEIVFQLGVEPLRVDILPGISGVDFDQAWERAEHSTYGNVPVRVIGREDYIANKRASGRPHDLRDVEALLELQSEGDERPSTTALRASAQDDDYQGDN
jgi:hypothetical protein